jgi:hypothetical protein
VSDIWDGTISPNFNHIHGILHILPLFVLRNQLPFPPQLQSFKSRLVWCCSVLPDLCLTRKANFSLLRDALARSLRKASSRPPHRKIAVQLSTYDSQTRCLLLAMSGGVIIANFLFFVSKVSFKETQACIRGSWSIALPYRGVCVLAA